MTLALGAYVADKAFLRSDAADGWTRDLTLTVPVDASFADAVVKVEQSLRFVSGDEWTIEPRAEGASVGARQFYKHRFAADAVCLFSGGTDGLSGAINLLEAGRAVALVSHFESSSDGAVQTKLAEELRNRYGHDQVRHVNIQVSSVKVSDSRESSTRSRSLLFIGLGLMVADAFGDEVDLYIPENGFVSINVPLTGSRQGSYSTPTTHPAYTRVVRAALAGGVFVTTL